MEITSIVPIAINKYIAPKKTNYPQKAKIFFAINRVRQYGEILKYMLDQITQIGTVVNHPKEVL